VNEARFPTTPGPWAVDIPSDRRAAISVTAVIADGGAPITIAAVPFKEPKQAHMRAIAGTGVGNARLIAAAPDMLDALSAVLALGNLKGSGSLMEVKVVNAIRKATGS